MILLLLACGGEPAVDSASPCRDGWTQEADGHCYPPTTTPPGLDDAIAALPPCEPAPEGLPIDIGTGCVGEAICPGATYTTISTELGESPGCSTASWDDDWVYCTWSVGVEGLFLDEDHDTVPDPEAGNDRVRIFWPFEGRTTDGVGVGATPSCFVESLGMPDRMLVVDVGGTLQFQDLIYERHGLNAHDWGSDDGSGQPNGALDNLYLYGQPE